MAVKQLDDLFNPGTDVLGTKQNEAGTISAQTGDVVGEEVHSDDAEWWQHVGLASRPAKAIAGKSACQAVTINQGSNDLIIATRDLRGSGIYGTLREGETCLYAPGPTNTGTGRVLLQDDGTNSTITITANGTTVTITGAKVGLDAPMVDLAAGASDAVALAPALITWAAAVNAALAAIAAALATPGPVVGPVAVPPVPGLAATVASSKVRAAQ